MKKLLVLALLGLVLGAGVWKAQNPEGTVDDFRRQADGLGERLQSGISAVSAPVDKNADASQQQTIEERIARLEESVVIDDSMADNSMADDALADDALTDDVLTDEAQAFSSSADELAMLLEDTAAGSAANVVRIDAIDSRLELLVRRLDEQTVEQGLATVQETLASLGADVASLNESVNAVESSVSTELASINEKVAALDIRLDTLAAEGSTALSSDAPDGAQGGNTGNLAASLDERFKALEARLATVNTDSRRIATLTEQLDSAREQIAQLNESTSSNRRNVNRLDGSVAELRTAGESLSIDSIQAEIRDQLSLVQSQFESDVAVDNAADLQKLLDNTRNRIQELEQRVRDLPAASTEASNAQEIQSALESQIVSLDQRLEEIGVTDPELATTLSNVQQKVDQLASSDFVTREDLRAQTEQRAVQYKIYFNRNSVDITEAAAAVLDSFITQEKNRTTGVSIFGFTDRLGSATYNQQLALQRATNVRSYLIQKGFDYTKIKALNGLGEDAAAAVLPDNADDAQQRVVVLYASQP